jgi:outer membrane immunogenic protein
MTNTISRCSAPPPGDREEIPRDGTIASNTWFGTARGRIGYAFDRFLPYFTGGAAFGGIKQEGAGFTGATSTQLGWVLGGGIEYAFLSSWSAKFEYLYADMGTAQCPATSCGTAIDTTLKLNIIRGGLNYKF